MSDTEHTGNDIREDNEQNEQTDDTPDEEPASVPELKLVTDVENGVEVTADQIVEALLFSGDSPLSSTKIASALGAITGRDVSKIVDRLNARYDEMGMSFCIESIAGGYQMLTRPEYATYLQRLYRVRSDNRLSNAALETLAVVAYKQPALRADVEAIRGVACGEVLRTLMEKSLIKIVGRAEELGRPMLYGTTKRFLEIFGLRHINDLPAVPDLPFPQPQEEEQTDEDQSADQGETPPEDAASAENESEPTDP